MPYAVPRVQVVPQPDDQVSFQVEGRERLRWHPATRSPRPFFFPLVGPSGRSLTRMGHPDAPDHNHHRGLWVAHSDVAGVNFWADKPTSSPTIRQDAWVHYQDGTDEAGMVVKLGWYDAHNVRLIQQDLIAVYRPLESGEGWLEWQTTFTPSMDELKLAKTNFGFFGLRVAASLSAHYGGGRLRGSEGATGEKDLFAKPAAWMDYSGPIVGETWEGVTWFDHPANPRHPTCWHVRDDGWMSPAFCLTDAYTLKKDAPLRLRYGFHVHAKDVDPKAAEARRAEFAKSPAWELAKAEKPWRWRLRRG